MDGLAEAFIDWTRGQSKDTQFGVKKKKTPKTCQNHFLDRLNKPPIIR